MSSHPPPPIQPWASDAPAPPPPPPGAGPAYAPPPPTKHHGALVAVLVIVVAVLLVLALNLTGVIHLGFLPGGSSTNGTASGAMTMKQAEVVANSTVAARNAPGTYVLADASMYVSSSLGVRAGGSYQPGLCQLQGFSAAMGSSADTGASFFWSFHYLTLPASGDSHLLVVNVQNGTGSVQVQSDPADDCPGGSDTVAGELPLNLTDSSAAFARASADGASSFLANHTSYDVSAEAAMFDVGGTELPIWEIGYESATCTPTGGTYSSLTVELEGFSLGQLERVWRNNSDCAVTDQIGSYAVGFGSATASSSLTYYENFTLTATEGTTDENFSLAILEPNLTVVNAAATPCAFGAGCNGEAPTGGGWYALLLSGGLVVASYPGGVADANWDLLTVTTITSSVTLEIISSTALHATGDTLLVFSTSDHVTGSTTL